jgi:hypothetical protein
MKGIVIGSLVAAIVAARSCGGGVRVKVLLARADSVERV